MNPLRSELQRITTDFVTAVMGAMEAASLADLAAQAGRTASLPSGRPPATRGRPRSQPQPQRAQPQRPQPQRAQPRALPARLPPPAPPERGAPRRRRATADEIKRYKDLALNTAKQLPAGFSKGDLMKRAGAKIDLGRALSLLVEDGLLIKKGDRRNTRYWLR